MVYLISIGILAPMIMMLFLMDKHSRLVIAAMILGIVMCLFAGEINSFLMELFGTEILYTTVTITPIVEEVLKAQIVLYFALMITPARDRILAIAMAVGIGFALMENIYVFVEYANQITIGVAIGRGLASGLMHGVCTAAVGYGISFIQHKEKLFYTGAFGLLAAACIYHAIFNALVQSDIALAGYMMPIVTYIIGIGFVYHERKKRLERSAAAEEQSQNLINR